MSHGVFQLENGPYTNYKRFPELPATVFEDSKYVEGAPANLLVSELQLPERALPEVDTLIGKFLLAIQQVSMISALSLNNLFPEHTEEGEYEKHRSDHLTTLSPEKLVAAIRNALETLLPEFLMLRSDRREKEQKERGSIGPSLRNPFQGADFLTPAVRTMLSYPLDHQQIHEIQEVLTILADSVMNRSSLSSPSTYTDTTLYREGRGFRWEKKNRKMFRLEEYGGHLPIKIIPPEDLFAGIEALRYSTLNPADLIRQIREQLPFLLGGILLRLHPRPARPQDSSQMPG